MSDSYRKDFSDKVQEKVTPDSQKSTYEKGKESVTNAVDHAAAAITPTDKKGGAQEAADSAHDAKKDAQSSGESYMDQAKDVVNSIANAASEKLAEARDYVNQKSESQN